jgi:hypothetical protein
MSPVASLPCSQHPTTQTYSEPEESTPVLFLNIHINIILPSIGFNWLSMKTNGLFL